MLCTYCVRMYPQNNEYRSLFTADALSYLGEKRCRDDPETEEEVTLNRISLKIENYVQYYKDIKHECPAWYELAKILVLYQPSSAAAERVFSMLARLFSKQQLSLLQNNIWIVLALRFHERYLN